MMGGSALSSDSMMYSVGSTSRILSRMSRMRKLRATKDVRDSCRRSGGQRCGDDEARALHAISPSSGRTGLNTIGQLSLALGTAVLAVASVQVVFV